MVNTILVAPSTVLITTRANPAPHIWATKRANSLTLFRYGILYQKKDH